MTMNANHLRTFLAVRKHMNYTRAAEDLFLSQPAVSRQIRQLETDLGLTLFEMVGKTLHLTDAGRALAAKAETLLATLDRMTESMQAFRTPGVGRLRLGASTTPGFFLLPSVVGRFHRRFPDVEIEFRVENSLTIERLLVSNELDLGFVGAHLTHEDLKLDPWREDEIICFAASSHPLASRKRLRIGTLESETWVVRESGSATRRLFDAWLAGQRGRFGPTVEVRCPAVLKALVTAGLGVSFLSIHGVADDLKRRRLKRLPVTGLNLKRTIFSVRHGGKHVSPVMRAFLELARP
jgi:DNA-binding transcriptional LysR family regulator